MYASCEFGGLMIEVDLQTLRVIRTLTLHGGSSAPQDVKLAPNGRTLYVADQDNAGVWEISPAYVQGDRLHAAPARAPTACTRAATRGSCTCRTARRARSR